MTPSSTGEQQVLDALRQVPAERWGDVVRFLEVLKSPSVTPPGELAGPPINTVADLLNSDLVGLWADRKDITDSREYARRLRYEIEHRWENNDASRH